MKDGYKTTEFWATVFGILLNIYLAVQGLIDPVTMAKVTGILIAVYACARAIAKVTPTTWDDELLKKIEAKLNS